MPDIRKGTNADIAYVFKRLWDRGQREIEKLSGYADYSAAARIFMNLESEHRYSFYCNGKPVAVFGAVPSKNTQDGIYSTWFLATEKFTDIARGATRTLKKLLEEKTKDPSCKVLKLVSAVDHPKSDRWFKMLGFTLDREEGNIRFYEYKLC